MRLSWLFKVTLYGSVCPTSPRTLRHSELGLALVLPSCLVVLVKACEVAPFAWLFEEVAEHGGLLLEVAGTHGRWLYGLGCLIPWRSAMVANDLSLRAFRTHRAKEVSG